MLPSAFYRDYILRRQAKRPSKPEVLRSDVFESDRPEDMGVFHRVGRESGQIGQTHQRNRNVKGKAALLIRAQGGGGPDENAGNWTRNIVFKDEGAKYRAKYQRGSSIARMASRRD